MNKQLQLLENEITEELEQDTTRKYSKRKLGTHKVEKNQDRPWKLSEKDRNRGLAGIAMIKQILASAPNGEGTQRDSQYAKAS